MHGVSQQKGFTLVELLAALTILALIIGIATPVVGRMVRESETETRLLSISSLERAGEIAYQLGVELEPDGTYNITELVKKGFIKLPPGSEFNSEGHFVARTDTYGTFVYMGEGLPETPTEPEVPDLPDVGYCPNESDRLFETTSLLDGIQIDGFLKSTGNPTELDFPDEICGEAVTAFAPYAFSEESLTRITLPEGVTDLPERVFWQNNLTHVELPPRLVSIGAYAFASNYFESIDFPDTLREIGSNAFLGGRLTSLDLPEGFEYMNTAAFSLNQITEVDIPYGVEVIEANTFHENPLTRVSIPDTVVSIDFKAFIKTKLTHVDIPASVGFIGEKAFADTPFTRVTIRNGNASFKTNLLDTFYRTDRSKAITIEAPKGSPMEAKILSAGYAYRALN